MDDSKWDEHVGQVEGGLAAYLQQGIALVLPPAHQRALLLALEKRLETLQSLVDTGSKVW